MRQMRRSTGLSRTFCLHCACPLSKWLLLGCRYRLFQSQRAYPRRGRLLSNFVINFRIMRLPSAQTVYVAIEHAECGGDENRIVSWISLSVAPSGRARSTSSVATYLPPFFTLPAIARSSFILSESGAAS